MCCNLRIKVLKDAEAHLSLATQERSYYKSLVDASKGVLQQSFMVDGELKPPCLNARLSPGTHNITMHYSFDMAQLVWIETVSYMQLTSYIIIGPLPIRSTAARTRVFFDAMKVWDLRYLLRSNTTSGEVL